MPQLTSLQMDTINDNREHRRAEIFNLVAYSCHTRADGDSFGHGVGRVVNLSKRGILIETCSQINLAEYVMITCMDKKGRYVRAGGRLIYSRINKHNGHYNSGICFSDSRRSVDCFVFGLVGSFSLLKRDQTPPGLITQILSRCLNPPDERWGLSMLQKFFEIQRKQTIGG